MPSFRLTLSEGQPLRIPVFKKLTTVGKDESSDIVLQGEGIERHHAQLVFEGRDFVLMTVSGASPFRINGKKKRKSKVLHHDEVEIGTHKLRFSVLDEGENEIAPNESDGGNELEGMRKLASFSKELHSLTDVKTQLARLLDMTIELTNATKGYVLYLADGDPSIAVARNIDHQTIAEPAANISDSIVKECIEKRHAIVVSDATNDTLFHSSHSVMSLKLSSVLAAPLIVRDQIIGVIYLGNDSVVRLFEKRHLDVIAVFASQASLIVHNAMLLNELGKEREALSKELSERRFGSIIGSCTGMQNVFRSIEKVAPTKVNVLVTGETGTGKELVAHELHRRSPRADGPFVTVNCGAIPENLMESELFGHVKGSFTGAINTRDGYFQAANHGTLFLDEIGEMPLGLQVKLLRALQERVVTKVGAQQGEAVDIRVVAATHRDLPKEIEKGSFREDLYYRLNVIQVHLPPLRERGDDIIAVAKFLLKKYGGEFGVELRGFTPQAVRALKNAPWPGNIRQLENRIKKAVVLAEQSMIGADELGLDETEKKKLLPLSVAREEFSERYVLQALEKNGGNRAQTARDLDVDPRTIFRYLERGAN